MMRLLKQIIYGSLYLAILAVVFGGVYRFTVYVAPTCFDNTQNQDETAVDCDGSCISCALKNAKLGTTEPVLLPAGDDRVTVLAEVTNQGELGATFEYRVDIVSSFGGILASFNGTSFIAPMDRRYIVIPGANLNPGDAASSTIDILGIEWDSEDKVLVPGIVTSRFETQITEGELVITGEVSNLSGEIIEVARVTAVLFSEEGDILSASASQIRSIRIRDSAPFKIFFPTIDELSLRDSKFQTKVFSEVVPVP